MELHRLEKALRPLYHGQPHHLGFEQALRLGRTARSLGEALSEELPPDETIDHNQIMVLAHIVLLGDRLRSAAGPRASIQSMLVSMGWTPLQLRLLFRSCEALQDKPTTPEEQVVWDAMTLAQLGALGFAQHIVAATNAGEDLRGACKRMRSSLTRRLYTRAAQVRAGPARAELKTKMQELERLLDG